MEGTREFSELKASIIRTILARRITLGVFLAVAVIVVIFTDISVRNPLFYFPVLWFLLTFAFQVTVERQHTVRALHATHAGYFTIEILLITVLVHFMGGSEWIGNVFYLFTVLYANFFLPRTHGALLTGWVVACYAGLVSLEAFGVIDHRSLFSGIEQPYRNLEYNLVTVVAGTAGVYAVVAFTVRMFAAIHERKNRMLSARELQLARMSRQLLTAQDEERRRIARELHDGLIQSLAAIKLHLAPVRDKIGTESHREISSIVDESIRQTRVLAYSLRPPLLDDLGLVPSLERLAETVMADHELKVEVCAYLERRLDVPLESLLYSSAQEAVQNVVRHASAHNVRLVLTAETDRIRLSVEDDGVGFNADEPRGFGLRGLEERVEVSGGAMTIQRRPQGGTRITVEVPCEPDPRGNR